MNKFYKTTKLNLIIKVARISLEPGGNSTSTGGIRTITLNRRIESTKGQFISLIKLN